jgi:hypothetical protein
LFAEDRELAKAFDFQPDFHNQLKARLLGHDVPIQVVRESTIAFREVLNRFNKPLRNYENQQAAVAWTLSTAAFYKSGGRPWKMAGVRKGVCYVGLVYKKDAREDDPRAACCAAQMFLDSGDGVVFKGAVGPWHTRWSEFHLSKDAAQQLISIAVNSFKERTGEFPVELFIHGRTSFRDPEWEGFRDGVPASTNVVGVKIRYGDDLKLFPLNDWPVVRGSAYVIDGQSAYLWTNGTIPRLATYLGRETPNPIQVEITRGQADITQVLRDILALTKLNYNSCSFGDGEPVTLKFADAVGEVLTAGPLRDVPPLPFRYYI